MPDDAALRGAVTYSDGMRGWIDQAEKIGERARVGGARRDAEMGAIAHVRRAPGSIR